MEDALAPNDMDGKYFTDRVLILVLMEDALARTCKDAEVKNFESLNPCFNGRCTRTIFTFIFMVVKTLVLILVLMEDALAQKKIMKKMFFVAVLILVLMEDALARLKFSALSYFIGVLILVLMEDALAQ